MSINTKNLEDEMFQIKQWSKHTINRIQDIEKRVEKLIKLKDNASENEKELYEEVENEYYNEISKIIEEYRPISERVRKIEKELEERINGLEREKNKKGIKLKIERELNEDRGTINILEKEIRNAEEQLKNFYSYLNEILKIKDCFKQYFEKKSAGEIPIESEKECTHQRKIRIAENKGMEGIESVYRCEDCGETWREGSAI